MASPIVASDIPVLADNASVCSRMQALVTLPSQFKLFLEWLIDSNGDLSEDVVTGIADRLTPIGTILGYATSTTLPSTRWAFCNGQQLNQADYPTLFLRIGTQYGTGTGPATFQLPNLADKFPLGAGATYPIAATGGETSHTLTLDEMPEHNHINGEYQDILIEPTLGAVTGSDSVNSATEANVGTSAHMLPAGDDQPHNNMPPYLSIAYIIKVS